MPCPIKLESPNISSSLTTNLRNATEGFIISNSDVSFQIGLNPLSSVNKSQILNLQFGQNMKINVRIVRVFSFIPES